MNIEEYRAMVQREQEEQQQQAQNPEGGSPNAQTKPTTDGNVSTQQEESTATPSTNQQGTKPTETNQTTKPSEEVVDPTPAQTKPQTVTIDGQEYTLDEIKNGYLRQQDYTRKTQELSRKEQQMQQAMQFLEQVQQNPQLAQQLSQQFNIPYIDPKEQKITDLENKYYDLLIQSEIRDLSAKYSDFDANEVLKVARDNNLPDLDTAYHVVKSRKGGGAEQPQQPQINVDELKTQLMEQLKAEMESNVDTSTIIQQGGDTAPVRDTSPQLNSQEIKVARMMGMKPEEYAKWRDVSKKKK